MNEKLKRFLKKIRITNVAAVAHPAHEHEGWAVIKSGTPDGDTELLKMVETNGRAIAQLEEDTLAAIEVENELRMRVARLADDTRALCKYVGMKVPA